VHPVAGDLLLGHDGSCDTRDGEPHRDGQVVGHEGGESIDDRPQLLLTPAQHQRAVIAEHRIVEQAAKSRHARPVAVYAVGEDRSTITTRCGLSGGAWHLALLIPLFVPPSGRAVVVVLHRDSPPSGLGAVVDEAIYLGSTF
jgi:hypothetical protein